MEKSRLIKKLNAGESFKIKICFLAEGIDENDFNAVIFEVELLTARSNMKNLRSDHDTSLAY